MLPNFSDDARFWTKLKIVSCTNPVRIQQSASKQLQFLAQTTNSVHVIFLKFAQKITTCMAGLCFCSVLGRQQTAQACTTSTETELGFAHLAFLFVNTRRNIGQRLARTNHQFLWRFVSKALHIVIWQRLPFDLSSPAGKWTKQRKWQKCTSFWKMPHLIDDARNASFRNSGDYFFPLFDCQFMKISSTLHLGHEMRKE